MEGGPLFKKHFLLFDIENGEKRIRWGEMQQGLALGAVLVVVKVEVDAGLAAWWRMQILLITPLLSLILTLIRLPILHLPSKLPLKFRVLPHQILDHLSVHILISAIRCRDNSATF